MVAKGRTKEGWENGLINWIVASDDDVESAKQELSEFMKDKMVQLHDHQHKFVFPYTSATITHSGVCQESLPKSFQ